MIHILLKVSAVLKVGRFFKRSIPPELSFFSTALISLALKEGLFGIRTVNILTIQDFISSNAPVSALDEMASVR